MTSKKPIKFIDYLVELVDLKSVISNLFLHRELIRTLTWRDFRARFQGSLGGFFWSVVQPLIMMVIYTVVFSSFLKVRFGASESPFNFAIYLLCGLLPWNSFSESFSQSNGIIRGSSNLVKRVVFPLEVLSLNLVLVSLIQQVIGVLLLLPLTWMVQGIFYFTCLLLPVVFFLQLLFFTGMNWIWASLSVYLPDLKNLTSLLVTALMFLSPIFYPESSIPPEMLPFIFLNPIAGIISIYRSIVMDGLLPKADLFWSTAGISLCVFLLGYFWFMHTKKGFSDVL